MPRRLLIFLFLLTSLYAKTPRPLANILVRSPDLKNINLKQYQGKVVVLAMIGTSCGDCIQTVDMLGRIQKEWGPRGLQVVAAAIENNAKFNVASFQMRYRPPFPVGYFEQDDAIRMGDMGPDARPFVPVLMFIDANQIVRFQYYGNDPFLKQGEKGIRAIIDGLLRQTVQQKGAAPAPAKQ